MRYKGLKPRKLEMCFILFIEGVLERLYEHEPKEVLIRYAPNKCSRKRHLNERIAPFRVPDAVIFEVVELATHAEGDETLHRGAKEEILQIEEGVRVGFGALGDLFEVVACKLGIVREHRAEDVAERSD